MSDVPGWDDRVRPSVEGLVDLVGDTLGRCRPSGVAQNPDLLAAAYLARCRRLLLAMLVLYDAQMPDVMGTPFRVLFEAWLHGMWVFYVRREAVERLDADYVATINEHIEVAGMEVDLIPPAPPAKRVPDVRSLAEVVAKHLVAEGDTGASGLPWTYDLAYRGESYAAIHGGLASVYGHFVVDGTTIAGVKPQRTEAGDGARSLVLAGSLFAMLARRVFGAFGLDLTQVDQVGAPIFDAATEMNEQVIQGED